MDYLTDPALSARHGFFTRQGGVSAGIYDSLNCGAGSADDPAHVLENRRRVANAMGVTPTHLVSLHQVHSPDVVTVPAPLAHRPEADAMVTDQPGLTLGILTADCAPVLFHGGTVVGAAHAGWKGALAGVTDATIDAMRALGAGPITAVIGPTISQRAYEVGPEFFETFVGEDQDASRFFANGNGDRMMFDLPSYILQRLRDANVAAHWIGHCTYSDPKRFFSYRRTTHQGEPDYGRLISAITL